eukprot:6154145-Heterocapsa_arctica.AAC.1
MSAANLTFVSGSPSTRNLQPCPFSRIFNLAKAIPKTELKSRGLITGAGRGASLAAHIMCHAARRGFLGAARWH